MNTSPSPVRRPSDAWPKCVADEYKRMAALPTDPVELIHSVVDPTLFSCRPKIASFLFKYMKHGTDYAALLAFIRWIKEGPKIVDITRPQYDALSQVEVRVDITDFAMPFPTVLFNMPAGLMHRYVIVHHSTCHSENSSATTRPTVIAASVSYDSINDITTLMASGEMEKSISTFHSEVTEEEAINTKMATRVAINMALAITNFGCAREYAFPKEVEAEKRFIAKGDRAGRDGRTASDRLAAAPIILTLDRTVKLWRDCRDGADGNSEPTGRVQPFHWVHGYWRMQPYGPKNSLRRRQYIPPYMVHAEQLTVPVSETTTVYKG